MGMTLNIRWAWLVLAGTVVVGFAGGPVAAEEPAAQPTLERGPLTVSNSTGYPSQRDRADAFRDRLQNRGQSEPAEPGVTVQPLESDAQALQLSTRLKLYRLAQERRAQVHALKLESLLIDALPFHERPRNITYRRTPEVHRLDRLDRPKRGVRGGHRVHTRGGDREHGRSGRFEHRTLRIGTDVDLPRHREAEPHRGSEAERRHR